MTTTQKQTVPALRFPEFSGEWKYQLVQSLVDDKTLAKPLDGNHGNIHPISTDFVANGIPFVMANDIAAGQIDLTGCKKISKAQASNLQKGFSISGDVLLTHKGSVGEVAIVPELSTDYIMLTPQVTYYRVLDDSRLDSEYLLQEFRTPRFQKRLKILADGGTRPYIGITNQRKLTVIYPSLPEQQKIASYLSAVDRKIEQLGQKKQLLERCKKGMMQKLFSQAIRFKDDHGNDFPDWQEKKAGDVFHTRTNKNHNGDLQILAATQDRGVIPRNETGLDIKSSKKSILSYKIIEPGDFVISLRSFQGGIEYSEYLGISSPAYIVLKPTIEIVDAFFKLFFKKESFISRLNNTVIGIRDGKQIPYSAFAALKLSIPSLPEQQKIADFLLALDRKIDLIATELEHAQTFKKGLLQQMFV